jgi:hypothetical protein
MDRWLAGWLNHWVEALSTPPLPYVRTDGMRLYTYVPTYTYTYLQVDRLWV